MLLTDKLQTVSCAQLNGENLAPMCDWLLESAFDNVVLAAALSSTSAGASAAGAVIAILASLSSRGTGDCLSPGPTRICSKHTPFLAACFNDGATRKGCATAHVRTLKGVLLACNGPVVLSMHGMQDNSNKQLPVKQCATPQLSEARNYGKRAGAPAFAVPCFLAHVGRGLAAQLLAQPVQAGRFERALALVSQLRAVLIDSKRCAHPCSVMPSSVLST